MRAVYLFLTILGITKAVPVEVLNKLDVDSIKNALDKFNENDIKDILNKLYVEKFRDSVRKLEVEQLKENVLDPSNQNFGPIESIIIDILERVRKILVNGTDTIPVLDPITIDRIHVDDKILPKSSYFTVDNLIVKDISTFEIEELKFSTSLLRQRLDFNIVIPAVNVNTSSYDLSLYIFGGHIFGKGDMRLSIVKPRVHGNLILGVRLTGNGLFLTIRECRINISLDSFEPKITGMFNDQTTSDFVAAFLKNLIPEMLDFFEEDITNILSAVTKFVGNLILTDLDLGSVLPRP